MGLDIDVSDNPRWYLGLFSTRIINLEDSEYKEEIQPGC